MNDGRYCSGVPALLRAGDGGPPRDINPDTGPLTYSNGFAGRPPRVPDTSSANEKKEDVARISALKGWQRGSWDTDCPPLRGRPGLCPDDSRYPAYLERTARNSPITAAKAFRGVLRRKSRCPHAERKMLVLKVRRWAGKCEPLAEFRVELCACCEFTSVIGKRTFFRRQSAKMIAAAPRHWLFRRQTPGRNGKSPRPQARAERRPRPTAHPKQLLSTRREPRCLQKWFLGTRVNCPRPSTACAKPF